MRRTSDHALPEDQKAEPTEIPFSVIKLFTHIEKAVAKIDTYPLNEANLVIQQDAYKRLASLDDLFEDDLFESFATINCSRKEKDTSLRFAVDFLGSGFHPVYRGIGTAIF